MACAAASPLAAPRVHLIGVSKGVAVDAIETAIFAGVSAFGENRVQEAAAKWSAIRGRHPHVGLHMVGALQTSKARHALQLFDCLHSLDRPRLAEALANELPPLSTRFSCFIQVNTGDEPQKSGIALRQADAFIDECLKVWKLPVIGLMCVPPANQPPAPHFALLRQIARTHGLNNLSMGMSGDYAEAIRMGATHVRIGTALFGTRPV